MDKACRDTNSAFITLLPKTEEANCGLQTISLVHSFAKLVTKLLANRLAGRLQQMVSPNQSAFIKGKFIQDNFMLVQQTNSKVLASTEASPFSPQAGYFKGI